MLQDVTFPSYVKIVEVGPRDGLQNIKVRHCFLNLKYMKVFVTALLDKFMTVFD